MSGGRIIYYRALPADHRERELKREAELGVPTDPVERREWWDIQMEVWKPWVQSVRSHRWRFQPDLPCMNCGQLTTVMQASKYEMTLCLDCLNTGVAYYPTGNVMANAPDYVKHSESCTSHSSYPTSSSSIPCVRLYSPSEIRTSPPSKSRSTSSKATPRTTQTTLFSASPSRPSASRRPMSLNSPTQKNSN